ncbi:carbohydrate-binding module family 24 protein [Cadophora sp. DSE1049]|nr:carbohydrate-binding module family 24 protein [Cadophora sp. DSE1049]
MWLTMRSVVVTVVLGSRLVQSAINLDGSQAVRPVTEQDPSPIANIETYYPDQHDCPMECVDLSNIHSWIPYFSVERLRRCKEQMLLQFSVTQPLDDPKTTVLIRSCTLRSQPANFSTAGSLLENPKKLNDLFVKSLDTVRACAAAGTEVHDELELASSSGGNGVGTEIAALMEGMQGYFEARDNCDENFLFAYHKQTVASIYVGESIGKPTVKSALEALSKTIRNSPGSVSNRTLTQLCGGGRLPERVFGISIDTTGDLVSVQRTAHEWSKGNCAVENDADLKSAGTLPGVKVFDLGGASLASTNATHGTNGTSFSSRPFKLGMRFGATEHRLHQRATCRYIQVASSDGCAALISKCGISSADLNKFNPKTNFCSTLMPGDYVCCSAGDPYTPPKPNAPKPNADGTCASYLIHNGDTCDKLAKQFGVTISDLEKFNQGKTWAWTVCKDMLLGYNMCLSEGAAPIPPPQEGSECGPVVPGTQQPTDKSVSMAGLNPCPLKACCSNWGYCGVFPAHCDIHAPPGGGPGSKEKGFQNTCVSNCGMDIKKGSGPPAAFQRIGYYESFNLDRDCLWLKAKNSNTDGSYTHIHWAFVDIDPKTWKPIIKDTKDQWKDFKGLKDIKRIVSFGGWAYSTEPATYNIIRSAILNNRDTFANNIAQFVKDENIDGVDIDWEYPGAPDILVDGQPIGQKTDGVNYLKFLTVLKQKVGADKSVSIAAPASFWYLKAFPIDRIAAVIDYIVYMTYDLHGQWDYGNANAFDSCPSGKCIRSHVNLTETRNCLAIITKAGVPNNKIFVGEASYGRAFHMAQDGCWGPTCDFTGSRTVSDANPGRCTKTGGYLAAAEINEVIKRGDGAQTFHDDASNTDVMLYKGDYVSYMTPETKDTRRDDWKGLNFAGSIDWAVDLQSFTSDDMDVAPERPTSGEEGCVSGEDNTTNSGDLCEFTCTFAFCPESLCTCVSTGPLIDLPPETPKPDVIAWDELDVDLNRLCKFACTHGYCPEDTCTVVDPEPDENDPETVDENNVYDENNIRWQNSQKCVIFKDPKYRDVSVNMCKPVCQDALDEAKEEGRTSNYGCMGFFPLNKEIPWEKPPGVGFWSAPGQCICDNMLLNEIADTVLEALPMIAQIGCYILMSSIKLVLDVGLQFIPGVGKALDAGMDMATTAAQMAAYLYPEEEDPEGAFSWWLSPCGGTDLVPEDIKKVFGILSQVAGGVSSFKTPKKLKKGSGKKGDDGNPKDRSKPRGTSGSGGVKPGQKRKCRIPASRQTMRLGAAKNTMRKQSCVADKTKKSEMIITSIAYAANAAPTKVTKNCDKAWSQACFHYSSVIKANPQWAVLTCPSEAGTTNHRLNAKATGVWSNQHNGDGWLNPKNRQHAACDRDEYPPAYLLGETDPAYINSGLNSRGQLVRFIPADQNRKAGQMWKGACFNGQVKALSDRDFTDKVGAAPKSKKQVVKKAGLEQTLAAVTVASRPEFSISSWGQSGSPPREDGLRDNPCWPKGIAAADPAFALMTFDPKYAGMSPPYDYKKKYVKGTNGS